MAMEFPYEFGNDGQAADDVAEFLKSIRQANPADYALYSGNGEMNSSNPIDLSSENNFSGEAVHSIKRKGLRIATLKVETVNSYLAEHGEDSLRMEPSIENYYPDYKSNLFNLGSVSRQIAYDPDQIMVPGSKSADRLAQEAVMRLHLEGLFGENSGLMLTWLEVWEAFSFEKLFFSLEKRPALTDWSTRCATLMKESVHAALGRVNNEEEKFSRQLFLESFSDNGSTNRLGVLAVFQPVPPIPSKEDSRLDLWRKELSA